MVNPNYQKLLQFCKKKIDQNPYLVKAIFVHVAIVIALYILSYISVLKFDSSSATLHAQVSKLPKKMQVIQATSISNSELNRQVSAYDDHQKKLRQVKDDIRKARKQALIKHAQEIKRKAEAELRAKQEAKRKAQEQARKKAEAERKAKEDAKKKAEAERKAKLESERKAKQEAERKAREKRLAKARAEAQAAARKQIEQSQAQSAISSYISEYQDRVGANWIKDSCRGIYNLPRAIIRDGRFIKLTGTSGNYRCDQALIAAIKNTTPPSISNGIARKTIQTENISFIFKQS